MAGRRVTRIRTITVCGTDGHLRRRLADAGLGATLGWTDQMPQLVAAADVVVENAGGLTSLEAFATGTPIVSYLPIPGHGRDNVEAMRRAGVTVVPSDAASLREAVVCLARPGPGREAALAAARSLFRTDPARLVVDLANGANVADLAARLAADPDSRVEPARTVAGPPPGPSERPVNV